MSSIYDPFADFSAEFVSVSSFERQDFIVHRPSLTAVLAMEKVRLEIEVADLPFGVSASVRNLRYGTDTRSTPRVAALAGQQQAKSLLSGGVYVDLAPSGLGHGLIVPIQFEVNVSLGHLFRAQFDKKAALEADLCLMCLEPDIVNNFTCQRNSCKFSMCDGCQQDKVLEKWKLTLWPSETELQWCPQCNIVVAQAMCPHCNAPTLQRTPPAAPTKCPHCNLESEVNKIGMEKGRLRAGAFGKRTHLFRHLDQEVLGIHAYSVLVRQGRRQVRKAQGEFFAPLFSRPCA